VRADETHVGSVGFSQSGQSLVIPLARFPSAATARSKRRFAAGTALPRRIEPRWK
jgi:hypothetical protein